jgi:cytochrome c553
MAAKRKNGFVVLLGLFIGLILVAFAGTWVATRKRLSHPWPVQASLLTATPPSPDLVARGKALANADGCMHCHTDNLGGKVMEETAPLGTIASTNLTRGGRTRTMRDWALAVRHGLRPDGTTLVGMPSVVFADMSDDDLGAIVAYANSLPPVKNDLPERHIGFLGNMVIGLGLAPVAAADAKHDVKPIVLPPGVSVERGHYRTRLCTICHGSDLGGLPMGMAMAPGPNLTPAGALGTWTEADFVHLMRTGEAPHGRKVNGKVMPWDTFKDLSDDDLKSIWAYLHQLPPIHRTGARPAPQPAAKPAA